MKHILICIIIVLCCTNFCAYQFGKESEHKKFLAEREYCSAWMELCHYYLYDHNPTNNDSVEANTYWYDVVMESDYYRVLDSLNEGDWEDWYSSWE